MLKTFLRYLPVSPKREEFSPPVASVPDGYHAPVQVHEQLALPLRAKWLQMLWDYSSLPKAMYQQYYLHPLERCVTLMQQFPATESGHHACLGGMVDYLLETTAYAARLSKSHLLPVDAPPEEQATQSAAWNAVIVYAAMVHSLDGLSQIEVELESGKRWLPLTTGPEEHYRFRFSAAPDTTLAQSQRAMRAWKIIPDEALHWLNSWPQALNALSLYLTGFRNESGIVHAIVSEAVGISTGNAAPGMQTSPLPATLLPTTLPEAAPQPVVSAPEVKPVSAPPIIAGSQEPVTLVSALDSTPPSAQSPDGAAADVSVQEEDMAGELLAVMGFSDGSAADNNNSAEIKIPAELKNDVISGDVIPSVSVDIGEKFWQWLCDGCSQARFSVNTSGARVHIIAGYVFIRTPGIFHQFLQENNLSPEGKSGLQSAFERLGRHRQDNGAMYTCHLYQTREKNERFQKISGYLILASKLYGRHNIPEENPLMIIKPENKQGVTS